MGVTKFSVYDKEGIFANLAMKYRITIQGHMINYYSQKNYFYFTLAVFINSNEETKKKILNDLIENKKINRVEDQGNFLICEIKLTNDMEKMKGGSLFYNPALIQIKPFIIDKDGWEELEFAAFERKPLERVLEIAEKRYQLKLSYLKQRKINTFGMVNVFPELTAKQKEVLDFAIDGGYYHYPRNMDIKKLSKKKGLSYSAFQEHLRRAENKLIPFLAKKSNI